MRNRAALLCLIAVTGAAAPAVAAPVPTLRTERVYFHCADELPVQNVALASGRFPGWSTAAPTGSVQEGAGCGYYENAGGAYFGPNRTSLDAEWEGSFTGNLDALTVELHNAHVSAARTGAPFLARMTLFVDGKEYFNSGEQGDLQLRPVPSGTGLTEAMRFTVAGVGLATEDGDGTRVRRYRVVLRSLGEEQSAWVFDTTEVPAGLTFNPVRPEALVVRVS